MLADEVKKIVAEYKEALIKANSEYAIQNLKINAFDKVLELIVEETKKDEVDAEIKALMREDLLLDKDDDTLAGKWGRE